MQAGGLLRQVGWHKVACLALSAVLVAFIGYGCGGESASVGAPYPSGLSAASSPEEVANVFIQALEGNSTDALLGLAAAKTEAKMRNEFFKSLGSDQTTTAKEQASTMVTDWGIAYGVFQKGSAKVADSETTGETAKVKVVGKKAEDGTPAEMAVRLIREDGLWKVQPEVNP